MRHQYDVIARDLTQVLEVGLVAEEEDGDVAVGLAVDAVQDVLGLFERSPVDDAVDDDYGVSVQLFVSVRVLVDKVTLKESVQIQTHKRFKIMLFIRRKHKNTNYDKSRIKRNQLRSIRNKAVTPSIIL